MATSEQKGIILYDALDLAEDGPADTALCREEVVQSALHKADEAAQPRSSWPALNSALIGPDPYLRPWPPSTTSPGTFDVVASESSPRWYPFPFETIFFPKMLPDGSGYRLRVTVVGASSSGGDRVDFGVFVQPHGSLWQPDAPAKTAQTTSTTPAALSWDDGTTYVDVPARVIGEAAALEGAWVTYEDIGGDPISVPAPAMSLVVMGQTWDAAAVPRLYDVQIGEYVGA